MEEQEGEQIKVDFLLFECNKLEFIMQSLFIPSILLIVWWPKWCERNMICAAWNSLISVRPYTMMSSYQYITKTKQDVNFFLNNKGINKPRIAVRNRLVIRIYQAACPTNKCPMDFWKFISCKIVHVHLSVLMVKQLKRSRKMRWGGPILESRSMLFGQFVWKR